LACSFVSQYFFEPWINFSAETLRLLFLFLAHVTTFTSGMGALIVTLSGKASNR